MSEYAYQRIRALDTDGIDEMECEVRAYGYGTANGLPKRKACECAQGDTWASLSQSFEKQQHVGR
jgi:hypothetical protein